MDNLACAVCNSTGALQTHQCLDLNGNIIGTVYLCESHKVGLKQEKVSVEILTYKDINKPKTKS